MDFTNEQLKSFFGSTDLYPDFDGMAAARHLGGVVQFATISNLDQAKIDPAPFVGMHKYLESAYPLIHKHLEKTVISDLSLLYYWPGSDPSLKPILFMAHQDVVPVMPGTEQDWLQPPYSGNIADGCVWGRGAMDMKDQMIAAFSSVEYFLEKGAVPKRGIYLAFGHDEEVLGLNGAVKIVEHLKAKGVELEFLVDEGGGFIVADNFGAPGLVCAKVDLFEKGYVDLMLTVNDPGGHSSRPGKSTALGKMARAIAALEANQFEPEMNDVVREMAKTLAPYVVEEPFKTYFSDIDRYEQDLLNFMMTDRYLSTMVHTTTAATMISGSPAPNVLPQRVEAVVNFRLAPQDSIEKLLQHCRAAIDDSDVQLTVVKGRNPSRVSKTESLGLDVIHGAIRTFFPDMVIIPGLITAGTDACHYEEICDCCYRFRPFVDSLTLWGGIHGTNERVMVDAFAHGIKAYLYFIEKACL